MITDIHSCGCCGQTTNLELLQQRTQYLFTSKYTEILCKHLLLDKEAREVFIWYLSEVRGTSDMLP